jgi:ketosteroid isomerase-like protein
MVIGEAAIAKAMEVVQLTPTIGYTSGTYCYDFTLKSGRPMSTFEGKVLTMWKKQADGTWNIYRDCFNTNVTKQ